MAVFFHSSESDITFEVGEYQQFPKPEAQDAAAERAPKPKLRHLSVVLMSFGLLCVLQGILNISLRLAQSECTECPDTGFEISISEISASTGLQCETEGETEEESCPQDWHTFDSSCYYVSSERRSWDDSRQDCRQRDADLVIINSRQEQAFLSGLTMAAWVGMTDRDEEGTWIWVDGTPVDKDGLQWARGQPDDSSGGEDCGDLRAMTNFTGLNDYICSKGNGWVCEKTW